MFFWLTVIRDDIDMNKYLFLNRNKNRKVDDEDVEEFLFFIQMFFWLIVIRDDIDIKKDLFLNRKVGDEDVEECLSSSSSAFC